MKKFIFEICPECDTEVELRGAKLKTPMKCPNCGKYIMPCSLCYEKGCGCDDSCKWQKLNRGEAK